MNTLALNSMAFDNFEVADIALLSESEGGGLLLGITGAVVGGIAGGIYGAATGGTIGSMVLPGIGTVSGATIKGVRDGVALGGALGMAGAAVNTWGPWI
ncbi:bacteriocin [Streptococcus mutans]|uniref:bacteriocin n=1 Tax=Streptococcus mutans TaxID=1309 RepID=UPI0014558874|nr:bacteriocin [Streptococcus mutans]MCY7123137.1 bacteriocin [Streptococcus mutans]MDW5564577.1 bacteriocin [Streptococcus mutans]NLR05628.1 bacteriocin [Streptococcus mutans]